MARALIKWIPYAIGRRVADRSSWLPRWRAGLPARCRATVALLGRLIASLLAVPPSAFAQFESGCSPDNAACEGFFGRLKTELFYSRDWQAVSTDQFIEVVDSYIRWYNEKRIKISLGALSPIEYRESLGLTT